MIKSEEMANNLREDINRWVKYTKADFMLRDGDIENLVRTILGEFYHVTLSCGHMVESINEGVVVTLNEYEGKVTSIVCDECAKKYDNNPETKELQLEEMG